MSAALASVMLGTLPAAAQRGLPGLLAVELAAGPADGFLMHDSRGCTVSGAAWP